MRALNMNHAVDGFFGLTSQGRSTGENVVPVVGNSAALHDVLNGLRN